MEMRAIAQNDAEVWETSVEEVTLIFREALVGLAPILNKAHIPIKDAGQYDDYDAITETLYERIVRNSIKWAFADSLEVEIPAYGFEFDAEKHNAFIEVCFSTEVDKQKQYVFQNFSGRKNLFDTVVCYPLGKSPSLFFTETMYVPVGECSFQLRYKHGTEFSPKSVLSVLL
jgi:hypothetical protein